MARPVLHSLCLGAATAFGAAGGRMAGEEVVAAVLGLWARVPSVEVCHSLLGKVQSLVNH